MRAAEVRKIYAERARTYNKDSRRDEYVGNAIMIPWIFEHISAKKVEALDLGCGTGLTAAEFFKKGWNVTGIDISPEMIEIAKQYPYEKIICQDFEEEWKLGKRQFDLITAIGVTEFIEDMPAFLKQVRDHLKQEGSFFMTVPKALPLDSQYKSKSYSKKEIEDCILKSGLAVAGHKTFRGYKKKIRDTKEIITYYGYMLQKRAD